MSNPWLFLLPFVMVACQNSVTPSGASPPQSATSNQPAQPAEAEQAKLAPTQAATVSQALGQANASVVQVNGLYFGWNGPCAGKPPTRSAWQLVESNAPNAPCIYVDGPALSGVSPNAPPANLLVLVRGKVVVDGDLKYIQADTVEKR